MQLGRKLFEISLKGQTIKVPVFEPFIQNAVLSDNCKVNLTGKNFKISADYEIDNIIGNLSSYIQKFSLSALNDQNIALVYTGDFELEDKQKLSGSNSLFYVTENYQLSSWELSVQINVNDVIVVEKSKFLINNEWRTYEKGTLGNSLNAKTQVLGIGEYSADYTLKEAIIEDKTITSLVLRSFYRCSNLSSINCPNVNLIGEDAFYDCSNLSSINCQNVKTIGYYAFQKCSNLSSIDLPNVKSIGDQAFYQCSNLSSIDLPNVNSIGYGTFYHCSNLSSVIISDSNPNYSTDKNHSLLFDKNKTEIKWASIPCTYEFNGNEYPNLTSIGNFAFYYCSNLSSINIPNVNSIGEGAFWNCSNLLCVDFGTTMTSVPVVESNSFNGINKKVSCYVPNNDTLYNNWITAYNWSTLISDNKVAIIKHGSV